MALQNFWINLFQRSASFHLKTSHFTRNANQMHGLYIKCNTGLKWFNLVLVKVPIQFYC